MTEKTPRASNFYFNTFKCHVFAPMGRFQLELIYNHRKINTLEEIEILKAASSKYLFNDVIAGQNGPIYKLLPASVIWIQRSTAQAKQQTKIQNFKDQLLQFSVIKLQLVTAQTRRQK